MDVPPTPPMRNSLTGVAARLRASSRVVLLTGAGVSVAAGIPDFRSPGGLFQTLPVDSISATDRQKAWMRADPTAVVNRDMFFQTSLPYLEVRRPFILGTRDRKWRATAAHRFAEALQRRNKLLRVFTQNIDGLDFQTAVPRERIVPVHGSIATVACESCGAPTDPGVFCEAVRAQVKDIYGVDKSAPLESTPIICTHCGKPAVKPTTVLFGASLPDEFFDRADEDMDVADLLIIAGTSLVVSPANQLPLMVHAGCPRVVINREPVGAEVGVNCRGAPGAEVRDAFLQGDCEDVFIALAKELGWALDGGNSPDGG